MTDQKSQKIERLRQISKEESDRVFDALRKEALLSRFHFNTHNAIKLRKSLAVIDRLDLIDRTLLSRPIHSKHFNTLQKRLSIKWRKFAEQRIAEWGRIPISLRTRIKKPTDNSLADSHLRFFTLIDCVSELDHQEAIKAALRLKEALKRQLQQYPKIWCLGAIEAEVISLSVIRGVEKNDTSDSEKRKLDVCETLAESLKETVYQSSTNLFLIHFHGVLLAKRQGDLERFYASLKRFKRWSKAPRQIEIKKLSQQFAGKQRSTDENLRFISRYITKGGNDMVNGQTYLRYKTVFQNSDYLSEDDWVAKHWRKSALLKKERIEDGLVDPFSLTAEEVCELTLFIDRLMGSNRTRTGYLLSSGS